MSRATAIEVLDLLRRTTAWLEGRGASSARLDAELLLAEVLGCNRTDLYVRHAMPVEGTELDRYRELVRRRGEREPVSSILGRREFHSLSFTVTDDVLTPRPETEHLVDAAVAAARAWREARPDAPLTLADLGVGSGCTACALASDLPDARVHGTDASAAALEVARANTESLGLDDRVTLHAGDWAEPLRAAGLEGACAVVVSNPPYVRSGEWSALDPEVRDHDPRQALVAGPTGLEAVRALLPGAVALLAPGGTLALEVGAGQAAEVADVLRGAGLSEPAITEDLAGIERVVTARRPDDAAPQAAGD